MEKLLYPRHPFIDFFFPFVLCEKFMFALMRQSKEDFEKPGKCHSRNRVGLLDSQSMEERKSNLGPQRESFVVMHKGERCEVIV